MSLTGLPFEKSESFCSSTAKEPPTGFLKLIQSVPWFVGFGLPMVQVIEAADKGDKLRFAANKQQHEQIQADDLNSRLGLSEAVKKRRGAKGRK